MLFLDVGPSFIREPNGNTVLRNSAVDHTTPVSYSLIGDSLRSNRWLIQISLKPNEDLSNLFWLA